MREDPALLSTAVEEVLRWASSAAHSMGTATRPVEIRGRRIAEGDRVVLWAPSANRDEAVFDDSDTFDIARTPNRHLAFGSGKHLCIDGTLARAQMRILYTELLDTATGIEQTGPAHAVPSIAVRGPETLPIRIVLR
ncbi:cytochrome P450 [Streptomyces sp. TRM70350]|uniref:cytochrome P450 n=1 Tax=Streptomyces sp. TRM70350 TaxID=2856165 RepID=UPI002110C886|nr:cytochrome P450 [Streptomyces sp. TRM70350]